MYLFSMFFICENTFSQTKDDSVKSYLLNQVIVTANKFDNKAEELSTRIDIIDCKEISKINGTRLNDKLRFSPSVFIKSYGLPSSLQTIAINGLGSEHTLILIDGIKINSFQNSTIDLSTISLESIERIEIINNGLSSIYGSDAIGGVVNLISRTPYYKSTNNILSAKGSLSLGSFNTNRNSLSLNTNIEGLSTELNFLREQSDGNYEYYFDSGKGTIKKQRQRSAYRLLELSHNSQFVINSKNRIKILNIYSKNFRQIPGLETGTPPYESSQDEKNLNNLISFEHSFTKNSIFKLSFNYQNNLMKYELKPLINSYYKNLVYSINTDYVFDFYKTKNLLGYSFTNASIQSNELEAFAKRNQQSIYFSSRIPFSEKFILYTSSRGDYFSDLNKYVFTHQAGINIKPFDDYEFRIKSNIGKNFRTPTFNDLYWKGSGNRELKPETSINKEISLMYELYLYFNFLIEFSYTNISAKNKIVWTPQRNFIWKPENISNSVSNSYLATLSLTNSIKNINLKYDFSFNYVESRKTSSNYQNDPTKDKFFPYIPIESIKQSLFIEFRSISINLFHTYYGKRFSDFENKKLLRPINLLDGNITISSTLFGINNLLKFEINNITNTDYQIISGYPMPLRNFNLTLTINIKELDI